MKICIDPGHYIGSVGNESPNGIKEAQQNYPIAILLKKYLSLCGFDVITTNEDINKDITLYERVQIANNSNCDLFISIHKNAYTGTWQSKAKGIETYVFNKGLEAYDIAIDIHNHLIIDSNLYNRGIKTNNFYVLRETKMSAILVELGFMDYKLEAQQMLDVHWHELYAKAICKGICEYYKVDYNITEIDANLFYRVVSGSYKEKINAEERVKELKESGFDSFIALYRK